MIAAVVTQQDTEYRVGRKHTRAKVDERPVRKGTSRTAHADPRCSRVALGTVVAENVDISTAEAGLPCDWCIPNLRDEVIVDAAEVAEDAAQAARDAEWARKTSGAGNGNGQRAHYPVNTDRVKVDGVKVLDKPNRYAGACAACGSQVAAGAGLLAKRGDAWTVVHEHAADCREPEPTQQPEPQQPKTKRTLPDVPAGRFAIASKGDNDLMFVKVDRPDEGKWAGYTFVKIVVGGHDDTPVRDFDRKCDILQRIVDAGFEQASALYGRELGHCGRCGRSLTDQESRNYGIGPECRKKGW